MIDYQKREAALCHDYLAGINTPDLAERYGITRERVRQIIGPHGLIADRQKQRAQKRADRAAAKLARVHEYESRRQDGVEMVENGVSVARACRATKISYTALRAALEQRGVKSIHGRWRDETVLRRRISELIAAGVGVRDIKKTLDAEKFKVSVHWIYDNFAAELRAWKPPAERIGVLSADVNYLDGYAVAQARQSEQPANDNNPAQEQEAA